MNFRASLILIVLALLQSCSEIVNVPSQMNASSNASDYFWSGNSADFRMTFGLDADHFWSAYDSGGTHFLSDGVHRLTLSSDNGKTVLTGLDAGSLIDLDTGMYFSAEDSVRSLVNTPRCVQFVESSGALYVGCDSGLFIRETGTAFFRSAGLAGSVTAIAYSAASHSVLVGLSDGTLWSGADKNWSPMSLRALPVGPIQAIAVTQAQEIYCAVSGAPGFYKFSDVAGWSRVPYMNTSSVTLLYSFVTNVPTVQKVVAIATKAGEIGVLELDGYSNPDPRKVADRVSGFSVGDGGALLAATSAGILSGDVHSNVWTQLPTPVTSNVTAIHTWYPQSGPAAVYYATPGAVLSTTFSGSPHQALPGYGPGDVLALGHFDQSLYAVTPLGCYEYQSSWSEIPGLANHYYSRVEGPLVLLQDPITVSSSWDAGRLVDSRHQTFRITGRVLEHLDTLHVGLRTYSDVLMVRYSQETPSLTPESSSIPYWVLYYARQVGLVLAEKVRGDSIVSRETRH